MQEIKNFYEYCHFSIFFSFANLSILCINGLIKTKLIKDILVYVSI